MFYRFCGLRPGMIKFMLILAFIYNVVGWEGLKKIVDLQPLAENSKFSREESERRRFSVDNYIRELTRSAEEKISCGKTYSPYDYFQDLKLICNKEKELEIAERGNHLFISQLQNLSFRFIGKGKAYDYEDVEKARNMYPEFSDPAHESREEVRAHLKEMGWGILNWFWLLYLKTLPLVFILYLLWAKEEQGYYEKFLLPKPLKFCLMLIAYPFIIGYFIFRAMRENGREIYAEAQLRRTKKLFSHISEEEQGRIEAFSKSNLSLSYWKQQLADLGLKPKHNFALALAVTMIFVFAIRPLETNAKSVNDFSGTNLVLEQISTKSLPRMSIDNDKKIQPEKTGWSWERTIEDMAVQICEFIIALSHSLLPRDVFHKFINEFIQEIFHVPLSAVRHEMSSN